MKTTSIIILAYKEYDKFKKMFEFLIKHTNKKITPYEIIVIDNDAEKEIKEYIMKKYDEKLINKIYIMNKNVGTSKGFNIGAKYSNGYYLCFFNSDYYMCGGWLESMIKCFEHKNRIGLISCATNITGNIDEKIDMLLGIGDPVESPYDYKETDCCLAQMFTTKDIWKEVGGFNEAYYPVEFEDLDFSMRVKKKGYKLFVNRKCWGFHDHGKKSMDYNRLKTRGINRSIFLRTWGNVYSWA